MNLEFKEIELIPEVIDAIRVRVDVFIGEQGFAPGWEPDEDDKEARQFIALADGKIVSTARMRFPAEGEAKIERMATRKEFRGKGVGSGLLNYMMDKAREEGAEKIWVNCQQRSKEFYKKCGFKETSEPVEQWGHPHLDMVYEG